MRGADFSIHNFVGLAKQSAAFAVPEHDVMHKQVAKQRSADFAGKRAVLLPIHVLSADLYVLRFAECFHYFCNRGDRKSTRLNSSHSQISYAVFCLKKKKKTQIIHHLTRTD